MNPWVSSINEILVSSKLFFCKRINSPIKSLLCNIVVEWMNYYGRTKQRIAIYMQSTTLAPPPSLPFPSVLLLPHLQLRSRLARTRILHEKTCLVSHSGCNSLAAADKINFQSHQTCCFNACPLSTGEWGLWLFAGLNNLRNFFVYSSSFPINPGINWLPIDKKVRLLECHEWSKWAVQENNKFRQ